MGLGGTIAQNAAGFTDLLFGCCFHTQQPVALATDMFRYRRLGGHRSQEDLIASLRHSAYTIRPIAAAMAVSRPSRHVLFQRSHTVRRSTANETAIPAGARKVDGCAAARLRSTGS